MYSIRTRGEVDAAACIHRAEAAADAIRAGTDADVQAKIDSAVAEAKCTAEMEAASRAAKTIAEV
jgi:hypothetical protein